VLTKSKLKIYQQLRLKKFRQKYGLFVVEGLKSVNELVNSTWPLEQVICSSSFSAENSDVLNKGSIVIDDQDFKTVSQLSTPSGILAVAKYHSLKVEQSKWQIAIDGISDPGNFGTILRIADWYGINTIYCSEDTVDQYNAKSIISSMGSFLRVKVIRGNLEMLVKNKQVYATMLEGEDFRKTSVSNQGILMIGSESRGISKKLLSVISHKQITIPNSGGAESLNAAMATAICCERFFG